MIETLLGGLLGGAFRLAPEILKWLDRKGERGHELAMQDKALEFEKIRGAQRMAEIGASAEAAWNVGAVDALREAVRTQGEKTGVRWADALSISVRPVITYWFMALYCAAKTAAFAAAVTAGAGWGTAILHAWTEADQALWAGVLNFWFLGRVFDRGRAWPGRRKRPSSWPSASRGSTGCRGPIRVARIRTSAQRASGRLATATYATPSTRRSPRPRRKPIWPKT